MGTGREQMSLVATVSPGMGGAVIHKWSGGTMGLTLCGYWAGHPGG